MQNPMDHRIQRLWLIVITLTLIPLLLTLSSVSASGNSPYQDMVVTPEGTPEGNNGSDKITICHATGRAANPYELITVSANGANGHDKHEGDIIPAPAEGCPTTSGPVAEGTSAPNSGNKKITICHATGSTTNPYELITISINGLNGHEGHGDLIPAPASGCPSGAITVTPTAAIPCGDVANDGGFPVLDTRSKIDS